MIRFAIAFLAAALITGCSSGGSPGGIGEGAGGSGGSGGFGGQGGSGGSGGQGGSGGSGGSGGDESCGTDSCSAGERCNRSGAEPRCECTRNPSSCAEESGRHYCNSSLRCALAKHGAFCDTPGEYTPDGKLFCIGSFDEGYWLELCARSSECSDGVSFCDKVTWGSDGELGICSLNVCGDERQRQDGTLKNGGDWGACDPEVRFPEDASAGSGWCMPFDSQDGAVFLCIAGGKTQRGEPCRLDTNPRADEACAVMTHCVSAPLATAACATDGECDPLQVCTGGRCAEKTCAADTDCGDTGYCYDDGEGQVCRPFGTCTEICNAGTGDSPSCSSPDEICVGALTERPDFANARGYCGAPGCDMLGGPDECPEVGGIPRLCLPGDPVKDHPFMGVCAARPDVVKTKGASCVAEDACEQGSVCVESPQTEARFCRAFCECPEADWDSATGHCRTAAEQCADTEVCARSGGLPFLGACLPR